MMRKAKKTEPSAYESLGLPAAFEGDVPKARTFIGFVQREISNLGVFSELPKPVQVRLQGLAHEIERVECFLEGFQEALQSLPATAAPSDGERRTMN